MSRLIVTFIFVCMLASCAELAVMTAPTGSSRLPHAHWGAFEAQREFVTTGRLALVESTQTLILPKDAGWLQRAGERISDVPKGSRLTITRIGREKYIDPSWERRETLVIYADLESQGRVTKRIEASVIRSSDQTSLSSVIG